jgi:hypothetical protein
LKKNKKQIGENFIENLLVNVVFKEKKKKKKKDTNPKRYISMPLYLGMGLTKTNSNCPKSIILE